MRPILLLLLLASCLNRADSPEAALREFVDLRLEKIVSRTEVLQRTTGKLNSSIDAMSDEEFSKFSDLKKFRRESFRVLSKSCVEKRCYLTYSLGYRQMGEKTVAWSSEVKKIAEVQWLDGKWLIADVSNVKTYHEANEAIEVTP